MRALQCLYERRNLQAIIVREVRDTAVAPARRKAESGENGCVQYVGGVKLISDTDDGLHGPLVQGDRSNSRRSK